MVALRFLLLLILSFSSVLTEENDDLQDDLIEKLRNLRENLESLDDEENGPSFDDPIDPPEEVDVDGREFDLDGRQVDVDGQEVDVDGREDEFEGYLDRKRRALDFKAVQIEPLDVTLTQKNIITTISADLTGQKISTADSILEDDLRQTIVTELREKGITSVSGDQDAFLQQVNTIILDHNNIDQPDPDYASLFSTTKTITLPKTRTLTFSEIQHKSLDSLSGTTVDFTTITKTTAFTLNGATLNMKALSFDQKTTAALRPFLADRSVADFMVVASGMARLRNLVAERNGLEISNVMPIEDVALYEMDISLEDDDIETILNETAEEPDLLVISPTLNITDIRPISTLNITGISPVTSNVVPKISASVDSSVQTREMTDRQAFQRRVKEELGDLLEHLRRKREASHVRVKRKVTSKGSAKWGMPIKYRIKSGPTTTIKAAIAHWEEHTCLRFKETGWMIGNHLKFQSSASGCWSKLGRKPGYIFGQPVNIGTGCNSLGIVAHEIGHAIGFWHEQSRPDRDTYIKINSGNIQNGRHSQFVKKSWKNIFSHGVSYDYSSVMHYGSRAFSKNGSPTIETKEDGYDRTIGQRQGLSFFDTKMANYHYNCHTKCGTSTLTWSSCQNNGYRDPNNCSKCKCPDGWTGTYCNIPMTGTTTACGNKYQYAITTSWKSFQTPNYPIGYPANARCTWKVYASYGHRINLRFNSADTFDLQCRTSCNDYVEIMYKHLGRAGERYCCSRPTKTFISHGTSMLVNFRVNSNGGDRGFKAEYKAQKCGGCKYGSTESTQAVCYRGVKYSCPGKYYVGCGFWNLRRCARYRSNTCYRTESYCCENNGYIRLGSVCRRKYGSWGSWGSWSSCSATCGMCGSRTRQRTRSCLIPTCTSSSLKQTQTQKCPSTACPFGYRSVSRRTTTKCGFLGWRRCTKIVYRAELKPRCCSGYTLVGSSCVASG